MISVDPYAVSFFTTAGMCLAYYYGRHSILKIIENSVKEKQEEVVEAAIDHCVDRLIEDGYLLSIEDEDGDIELIKLEDEIKVTILAKLAKLKVDKAS